MLSALGHRVDAPDVDSPTLVRAEYRPGVGGLIASTDRWNWSAVPSLRSWTQYPVSPHWDLYWGHQVALLETVVREVVLQE